MNIIGHFIVDQSSVTEGAGLKRTIYLNNRKPEDIFYSRKLQSITTGDMFLMQEKDGSEIKPYVTPVRVAAVREYTVDDNKNMVNTLILDVTLDQSYFDRTVNIANVRISPFGEYTIYHGAVAIVANGSFENPEDVDTFKDEHPFIAIDNKSYMYIRTTAILSNKVTITGADGNPETVWIRNRAIMIYSEKAAYNVRDCDIAERALINQLAK